MGPSTGLALRVVPHRCTPHVISVAHMLTYDFIANIIHATAPQGVNKLGTMLAP